MPDRYWKLGTMLFTGVPLEGSVELTKEEYEIQKIEELKNLSREMRNSKIEEIEWRIRRYHDEEILGISHTDDIFQLASYVQALRDVPQQAGFPEVIDWPKLES